MAEQLSTGTGRPPPLRRNKPLAATAATDVLRTDKTLRSAGIPEVETSGIVTAQAAPDSQAEKRARLTALREAAMASPKQAEIQARREASEAIASLQREQARKATVPVDERIEHARALVNERRAKRNLVPLDFAPVDFEPPTLRIIPKLPPIAPPPAAAAAPAMPPRRKGPPPLPAHALPVVPQADPPVAIAFAPPSARPLSNAEYVAQWGEEMRQAQHQKALDQAATSAASLLPSKPGISTGALNAFERKMEARLQAQIRKDMKAAARQATTKGRSSARSTYVAIAVGATLGALTALGQGKWPGADQAASRVTAKSVPAATAASPQAPSLSAEQQAFAARFSSVLTGAPASAGSTSPARAVSGVSGPRQDVSSVPPVASASPVTPLVPARASAPKTASPRRFKGLDFVASLERDPLVSFSDGDPLGTSGPSQLTPPVPVAAPEEIPDSTGRRQLTTGGTVREWGTPTSKTTRFVIKDPAP
ncbi:MAG: hypothetical protein WDO70_00725 [Alphaproteobacteria bacterium]